MRKQRNYSNPPTQTQRQKNEKRFILLWERVREQRELKLNLEREVTCIPGKKYRYDFKVEDIPVLIEIHGGTYSRGKTGHNSGEGIARDARKVNLAQIHGYNIFVFTIDWLKEEYVEELYAYCENIYR